MSGWSFLEQLALAVGYKPNTEILMLWAYFDDSRAQQSVALGGSVATLEGWCRLLPKWEEIIGDSHMGWFHATEWQSQAPALDEHWRRLVEVMNAHLLFHVGCTVPAHVVKSLQERKKEAQQAITPGETVAAEQEWAAFRYDPMSVCLGHCLILALPRQGETVSVIFAKTDKLHGRNARFSRLLEIAQSVREAFSPQVFDGNPRELIQLQVADLVAYELTAHGRGGPPRWQFSLLRSKLRHHRADPPRMPNLLDFR